MSATMIFCSNSFQPDACCSIVRNESPLIFEKAFDGISRATFRPWLRLMSRRSMRRVQTTLSKLDRCPPSRATRQHTKFVKVPFRQLSKEYRLYFNELYDLVRSEGGRICCDINELPRFVKR